MNNTDIVYQAIKDINAEGKLAEPETLANATGLSVADVNIVLAELDTEHLITHKSVTSTGRDNYGKVLDYGKIRAV